VTARRFSGFLLLVACDFNRRRGKAAYFQGSREHFTGKKSGDTISLQSQKLCVIVLLSSNSKGAFYHKSPKAFTLSLNRKGESYKLQ
jgi:hypothetical protein